MLSHVAWLGILGVSLVTAGRIPGPTGAKRDVNVTKPIGARSLLRQQRQVPLDKLYKGGKVTDILKFAEKPKCKCEASNPAWKVSTYRNVTKCLFFDLGAGSGEHFQKFLSGEYGDLANCGAGGWEAFLVEANPGFNAPLEGLEEKYGGKAGHWCSSGTLEVHEEWWHGDVCRGEGAPWTCPTGCVPTSGGKPPYCMWANTETACHQSGQSRVHIFPSTAAYMCQGTASFYLDTEIFPVAVPTSNLIKLISENAVTGDYVIVSMDVEDAEWEILPCLAESPVSKLIDRLYMRHKKSSSTGVRQAKTKLAIQGVDMPGHLSVWR